MSKVLIVEDDEALAQGLKRALASSQIETEVSLNLKNARKMIQSEEWSLILLDVNLPDGSGFDLSLLVANRGIIVKRETLLERVWTDGADFVDENALSVAIKRLRDKLDAQNQIKTVYGVGYIWEKDKA